MRRSIVLMLATALSVPCCGQGRDSRLMPKWMRSTVLSQSQGIHYVSVTLMNPSGQEVGALALDQLSRNIQNDWTISQSLKSTQIDRIDRENGHLSGSGRTQMSTVEIMADGQPVTVNCMLADEWWSGKSGDKRYCALYQVAENDHAVFDNVYPTNDYGIAPFFMSIIPGVGQFYKGDAAKGSLLLGGCTLTGVGAIFFENQRKSCRDQMAQTHDVNLIKQYSADERNYKMARNVIIGTTAALYIYNLLDAALAPGARRVKVTPGGVNISF